MGVLEGRLLCVGYGLIGATCFGLVGGLHVYTPIYILLWPGVTYTVIAIAYALNNPYIIGLKNEFNGHLNYFAVVAFAPFYVMVWLVWYVRAGFAKDPAAQQIIANLWIGRQPVTVTDLPPNTTLVIDLTAEFPRMYSLHASKIRYRCIPSLDTCPPPPTEKTKYAKYLNEVVNNPPKGNVYIHCANGHGRSAAFLIAAMYLMNHATSLEDAEEQLRKKRPTIKIRAGHKAFLREVLAEQLLPPNGGISKAESGEQLALSNNSSDEISVVLRDSSG